MYQKEVQIDNLIDYIKEIFDIPNYSKNFFNLDSLFKEEILRDMPNELNLLEQAIYIYIKLCINK